MGGALQSTSDAEELAKTLTDEYGYHVVLIPNATDTQIMEALSRLEQQLTESDKLLIYFSGHGERGVTGRGGYWLPVNAAKLSAARRHASPAAAAARLTLPLDLRYPSVLPC